MVIFILLLLAEQPELIRGTVERPGPGLIALKTAEGRVASCKVGDATHRDAPPGPWIPGDLVEGWMHESQNECRWLSLKLIQRKTSTDRPRIRLNLNPLDSIVQRGNLMFAGIILSVDGNRLNVRARNGTRYQLLLRPDTHLLREGRATPAAQLPLNQTVYMRAGANFDGEIEVFRIAWGRIIQPR